MQAPQYLVLSTFSFDIFNLQNNLASSLWLQHVRSATCPVLFFSTQSVQLSGLQRMSAPPPLCSKTFPISVGVILWLYFSARLIASLTRFNSASVEYLAVIVFKSSSKLNLAVLIAASLFLLCYTLSSPQSGICAFTLIFRFVIFFYDPRFLPVVVIAV